jgi:protein tyrosine/serine phosphatase
MAPRPSLAVLLPFALLACGTTSSSTTRARPTHWAQPMLGADVANWHRVDEQLYRCGQPDRAGMRALAAQGVRTVVNLRSWHSDRDEIAGTGMLLVEVPASAGSMDYADLVQALRAVVQAEKPVAVHCWHGSDRTGAVVAAWRVAVSGWTPQQALDEMVAGGFGHSELFDNLRTLVAGLDRAQLRADVGLPQR